MFNLESWTNEFLAQATTPMDEQQSQVFMNMLLSEGQPNFDVPGIKNSFLYQVIDSRAQHMGLNISTPAKMFLMFLTQSPGSAVMYLSALRQKTTNINMDDLANFFPMGFLSEEALEKMWDKQKGFANGEKLDNCLDHVNFTQQDKSKLKM